jgi:serine/threonine protein kinase
MEVVEGFPLSKLCDPLSHESGVVSVTDKLYLSWQLWCALAYLHSKQVYHIDIKPDNIMISWDMTAKLVDFGLSRYEADISVSRSCTGNGTWVYWPPEKPIEGRESPGKGDTWSLGLSLCEAYAMRFPFCLKGDLKPARPEHQFQFYQILHNRPDLKSLSFWNDIPNESMKMLSCLALEWDYKKRPSARQMETHAYDHLRRNLSIQPFEIPQQIQRRFTIRSLKKRQRALVPSRSMGVMSTVAEASCVGGAVGFQAAPGGGYEFPVTPSSSTYHHEDPEAQLIFREQSSDSGNFSVGTSSTTTYEDCEDLISELEFEEPTPGCCGISRCKKRKNKIRVNGSVTKHEKC